MLKTIGTPDKELELFILETKDDGCQVEKIMYLVDLKYVTTFTMRNVGTTFSFFTVSLSLSPSFYTL